MRIKVNKQKIKTNRQDINNLFSKIITVFIVLIILMFVVLPLVLTMNIMHYLRSSDFMIACVSLVLLYFIQSLFFQKKKPRSRKPEVQFKPQETFHPPEKIHFIECDMCKRTTLFQDIVEISNNVFVCKNCIRKVLGEKDGKDR